MPTVTANNCEMYYEVDDFTDPWVTEKETVWLQHGVGRSTKFWYHWVPALARHYRVVRRDMRGHGQSADPGPNHTWSGVAVRRRFFAERKPLCTAVSNRF